MSKENKKQNPRYPYPKKRAPKPNPKHRHKINWHGWKDGAKYKNIVCGPQ